MKRGWAAAGVIVVLLLPFVVWGALILG
jgi:hypothetical protein